MPEDDAPRCDADAPWVERSVAGLLRLLGGSCGVFFDLLTRPWWSPRIAREDSGRTPPLSFLIVCLLFAGLSVRVFVLYFTRRVDRGAADALVNAVSAWGPKDVLLLTVPIIVLIVLSGVGAARWTFRDGHRKHPPGGAMSNPVVRVVCYAAGFQIAAVGVTAASLLLLSFAYGAEVAGPVLDANDALPWVLLTLVAWSAMQVERGVAAHGNKWLAKTLFSRSAVAVAASLTTLLAFLTTGYFTFDLRTASEEAYRAAMLRTIAEESDVAIAAEVVAERSEFGPSGGLRVTQTVLLTNYTPHQWAVPRPGVLQPARSCDGRPCLPRPVRVEWCSVDAGGEAGWILQPRQSRLLRWTLSVPAASRGERTRAVVQMSATNADVERLLTIGPARDEGSRVVSVLVDWSQVADVASGDGPTRR